MKGVASFPAAPVTDFPDGPVGPVFPMGPIGPVTDLPSVPGAPVSPAGPTGPVMTTGGRVTVGRGGLIHLTGGSGMGHIPLGHLKGAVRFRVGMDVTDVPFRDTTRSMKA